MISQCKNDSSVCFNDINIEKGGAKLFILSLEIPLNYEKGIAQYLEIASFSDISSTNQH